MSSSADSSADPDAEVRPHCHGSCSTAWLNSWLDAMSFSVASLITAVSVPSRAALSSASGPSTAASLSETFSPCSPSTLVWYTRESALLRTSASSRRALSSSACASASSPSGRCRLCQGLTTSDRHRLLFVRCPVFRQRAQCRLHRCRMSPQSAELRWSRGKSTSWNLPRFVVRRHLSLTLVVISTEGCMSSAVVNTSVRLVGIVVLRSMRRVITPPLVSIPDERGDVKKQHVFDIPANTPACTEAPTATTSSG